MLLSFLALLCLLGFAAYVMTSEERTRVLRDVALFLEGDARRDRFLAGLRERTRWALLTPALILVNFLVMVAMLLGGGTEAGTPEHLVSWGANLGPRTTNGEWWRLVQAIFVHSGVLSFIANTAGLLQAGLVLERFVGPLTFASVYLTAGILANLAAVSGNPLAVSTGASGAVFGVYGLFISAGVWAAVAGTSQNIPRATLERLAPAAGIFVLYNMVSGDLSLAAESVGLIAGLVMGAVLTRPIAFYKPSTRRIATTAAASLAIAVAAAIPLRGLDDFRPELNKVVEVEERTASEYEAALERFKNGRLSAESLAKMIEESIVPELRAAGDRLNEVDKVTDEHQPLVASAKEYLRLRHESWRLRIEGLRKMVKPGASGAALQQAVTATLMQAERTERDSLASLQSAKDALH